jgi:hypothetical protein
MRVERIIDEANLPADGSYLKPLDTKRLQEKYIRHVDIEITEKKEG